MKKFQDLVNEAGENGLSYMAVGSGADAFDKYQDLQNRHGDENIKLAINIVYFQAKETGLLREKDF